MNDSVDIVAFQTRRMSLADSISYLENLFSREMKDRNADFIIMPEKWIDTEFMEYSESLSNILQFFMDFSKRSGNTVIPGSFAVKRSNGLFNSSPVISGGEILGWQDKISLFSREKERYTPGNRTEVFEAQGLKFTVSVCYDSDFPYYTRMAALEGSEIMFSPALIHKDFHDMWKIYIEARALENRLPFVSINSLSDPFNGGSMISVPVRYMFGAKLSTKSYGENEVIEERVSLEGLRELREARLKEDPGSYGFRKK